MTHKMIKTGTTLTCHKCGRVITFQNGRKEVVKRGDENASHEWFGSGVKIGVEVKAE